MSLYESTATPTMLKYARERRERIKRMHECAVHDDGIDLKRKKDKPSPSPPPKLPEATEAERRELRRQAVEATKVERTLLREFEYHLCEPNYKPEPSLYSILREVAALHSLLPREMQAESHHQNFVLARAEFCYRAMIETTKSTPAIGLVIDREHTTVLNCVWKHCGENGLPLPRNMPAGNGKYLRAQARRERQLQAAIL